LRIGIFTDSYKPYTSGVVSSIASFREELIRLGHEVYIFAPSYPNYEGGDEDNVYRLFSIPAPTNPEYTLAIPIYPGMTHLVRSLNLDIIHVHSPFTMGRVGLRYARKFNLPLVFTYHTRYDQYVHYLVVAQDLAKDLTIKYSSHFCNNCSHVIVPAAEIESMVRDFSVTAPISIIPTGVDLDKFSSGDKEWLRKHYTIPAANRILLFVGRLTQEKNLPFLIQTFKEVKDHMPATTLVITAQGPMEAELKQLVIDLDLSLDSDVIFTGVLPFETLVDVYSSADLFVFASLTETQGLVLLEAMAAGLPVAAVRAPGVQEMVDDGINGILTDEDTGRFSAAICSILADEGLYCKMRQNALAKAEIYSSRNMALRLEEVYKKVLADTANRPGRGPISEYWTRI